MSDLLKAFALFLSVVLCSLSLAGSESSSGTDTHKLMDGTAWFLSLSGRTEIKTCFEVSADFGFTRSDLHQMIKNSFKTWSDYFVAKKYGSDISQEPSLVLATNLTDSCDGSEDLKFYFGTTDDVVTKYKMKYNAPLAMAELLSYDSKAAWGKGFVWIAASHSIKKGLPDWSLPNRLMGILIHEVGHILGCEHVDMTLMTAKLAAFLFDKSVYEYNLYKFDQIDQERELVACVRCEKVYTEAGNSDRLRNAFQYLLHREPVGDHSGYFIKAPQLLMNKVRPAGKVVLVDKLGKFEFQLTTRILLPSNSYGPVVFKKVWDRNDPVFPSPYVLEATAAVGSSFYGVIKDIAGKEIPAFYAENLRYALWMSIVPDTGVKSKHIFEAFTY